MMTDTVSAVQELLRLLQTPLIHINQTPVTLGSLLAAVSIVVLSAMFSSMMQRVLSHRLFNRVGLQPGVAYALRRFVHYGIICFGVIVAVQCVGLNLSSLAVVLGFLSVGIGFGLQNITANFISGLILLFERPISVDDMVSVEQHGERVIGRVIQINMRSTIIRTVDNIAIIVPNSHLIENPVSNWSIDDLRVRIRVSVGVAYGSDVARVTAVLKQVADTHPEVLKSPTPEIRFVAFGNSSLDFQLLAWIDRPGKQWTILSELHYAVDAGFREAGIAIPFPQRDLHLKSTPTTEQLVDVLAKKN